MSSHLDRLPGGDRLLPLVSTLVLGYLLGAGSWYLSATSSSVPLELRQPCTPLSQGGAHGNDIPPVLPPETRATTSPLVAPEAAAPGSRIPSNAPPALPSPLLPAASWPTACPVPNAALSTTHPSHHPQRLVLGQGLVACGATTTGFWANPQQPFRFVQEGAPCTWLVSSTAAALRVLSGARLLFIGDSMTRELLFDLLRAVLGCGTVTVRDSEQKMGRKYFDSDGLAPASPFATTVCAHVNNGSRRTADVEFVVPLDPAFPDQGNCTFMFRWMPRIGQLVGASLLRTVAAATEFDAVVLGSFHWYRDDKKPDREARYLGDVHKAIAALRSAGAGERLQRKLYWRSPPLSRYPDVDPSTLSPQELVQQDMINNYFLVPLANEAMGAWAGAGYKTMNFTKYFRHEDCGPRGHPVNTADAACPYLTVDGQHPIPAVNLVMMRELLGRMAADGVLPAVAGVVAAPQS